MRTKAKAALIAAAAVVGVAGGIWFSWCRGIDYEKRYKDLFDKTFKGDYKITVTESGFYTNKEAPIKLPVRYKVYDVEYKDKNGNVRHSELDNRVGYSNYFFEDEKLIEYIKNRNFKADYDIMAFLNYEMDDIAKEDMRENIMPKYFDFTYDPESDSFPQGDGYKMICLPFGTCTNYVSETENIDKMQEFISPENCIVISDMDAKTYANIKSNYLLFAVIITDEDKYEMKDEYLKKVEAMMDEYSAASDFGGNYHYIVRRESNEGTELKDLDVTEVYVLNGEKITFDPNEEYPSARFREEIAKKCGYVISKK